RAVVGVGGAGAGVAVLRLARRGAKRSPPGQEDAPLSTAGQPYVQPSQFSDAGLGAYQNLQNEIDALTAQVNTQSGPVGGPARRASPSGTRPAARQQLRTTGRFGTAAGHPFSYQWLAGAGYLARQGGRWVLTGKGGTAKGHPADVAYLQGIGLLGPRPS